MITMTCLKKTATIDITLVVCFSLASWFPFKGANGKSYTRGGRDEEEQKVTRAASDHHHHHHHHHHILEVN